MDKIIIIEKEKEPRTKVYKMKNVFEKIPKGKANKIIARVKPRK
jgi:hypothetical protein